MYHRAMPSPWRFFFPAPCTLKWTCISQSLRKQGCRGAEGCSELSGPSCQLGVSGPDPAPPRPGPPWKGARQPGTITTGQWTLQVSQQEERGLPGLRSMEWEAPQCPRLPEAQNPSSPAPAFLILIHFPQNQPNPSPCFLSMLVGCDLRGGRCSPASGTPGAGLDAAAAGEGAWPRAPGSCS